MTTYLTGGGDQECFRHLDLHFFDELPKNSSIGVLAQAGDDPLESLARIEQDFEHQKISSVTLVKSPSEELLDYDALIIEGGNTFNLIRAVRDSDFFSLLKKFSESGKPLYADSAGAIVLGSDVHTAFLGDEGDEDQLRLQDYRGLDIIHPWCVHAHSTPEDFEELQNILYNTGNPIFALSEETGIRICDNEIEVFGHDPLWAITFMGKECIKPGEKRTLSSLLE
jgi:dipeptidase E